MAVKAAPAERPQWPPQVVEAMQNQLHHLFSPSSRNATLAAAAPGGTSSSSNSGSQLSYECTTTTTASQRLLLTSGGGGGADEASDQSCTSSGAGSSSGSGSILLAREDDQADADTCCTSACDDQQQQQHHGAAAAAAPDRSSHAAEDEAPGAVIGAAIAAAPPRRTVDADSDARHQRAADRAKRKGSPVTLHDRLWAELLSGRPSSWSGRLSGAGTPPPPLASGAQIELPSQPLPFGWEQFLDLKTGSLFYMNWESCERTCQDPRKRGRRDDGFLPTALEASDHDVEDTSSETLVDQSTSDYSFEDTLGSAQTEEASLMSSS